METPENRCKSDVFIETHREKERERERKEKKKICALERKVSLWMGASPTSSGHLMHYQRVSGRISNV